MLRCPALLRRDWKPNTIRWMLPTKEPGSFDGDGVGLRPGGVGSELAGVDGLSVLKSLRQRKANLPVMILTARSRVEDRVQCLDSGRNDYLVKPFSFLELSARRGRYCGQSSAVGIGAHGARLCLDRVQRKVERSGRSIELTTKEFALLEYLMRNAGGGSQGR